MKNEKVITRFPPSPTGSLHIGNIRTLLFNYLYARKHEGEVVMRFEDTDTARSSKEHEEFALEALSELGLDFDTGPFRQSERQERYTEALGQLLEKGLAYVAEESKEEPGENVIRFKNPNKDITFTDLIRGEITIHTEDFGDFVIARSRTNPIYHLSVVVDDMDMNVTHVIRGEDHMTSTPRQILLIEALGGEVPQYAHLPLIIGSDKKKLGKRHGAVTYQEFRAMGILPEAIINYLALLGWNPGDDREFFTKDELVQEFSLERVNNSPAMFSYEKLDAINKLHVDKLSPEEFAQHATRRLSDFPELVQHSQFKTFLEFVVRERIAKFADVQEHAKAGEYDWLTSAPKLDVDKINWKETSLDTTKEYVQNCLELLNDIPASSWNMETIKNAVWEYAQEKGKGDVLWPLRYALTGKEKSPDPFTVAHLLGKDEVTETLSSSSYAVI